MTATVTAKKEKMPQFAKMHFAYQWQCNCGNINTVMPERVRLREEEVSRFLQKHGVTQADETLRPEGYTDSFVTYPPQVVCDNCEETFVSLSPE